MPNSTFALESLYAGAGALHQDTTGGTSVVGGCECANGGAVQTLIDYETSVYSKAKRELIGRLAKDLFAMLKVKAAVDTSTPKGFAAVVEKLRSSIPGVKGNGKDFSPAFKASSASQQKLIRDIAEIVNRNQPGIIDMTSEPSDMYRELVEYFRSLLTGLSGEFVGVMSNLQRVLKNIQVVKGALQNAYDAQQKVAKTTGDSAIERRSDEQAKIFKSIMTEMNRQIAILQNLTDSTMSADTKRIVQEISENRDFDAMVTDLKEDIGTSGFSNKLANLLAGVSTVANQAYLVDKALTSLGMSLATFKQADTYGDLRAAISKQIQKLSPDSARLLKIAEDTEVLYNNNYNRDAVVKFLEDNKGKIGAGVDNPDSMMQDSFDRQSDERFDTNLLPLERDIQLSYADREPFTADGGAVDVTDDQYIEEHEKTVLPRYFEKKSIGVQTARLKKLRELIFKDFRKLLDSNYRQIVSAAADIHKAIGKELPITDELRMFVNAFTALPKISVDNIEYALSGYKKDSLSRETREKFIQDFNRILQTIAAIPQGRADGVFQKLKSAIVSMLREIDNFSDSMVKHVTEVHVPGVVDISGDLQRVIHTGGAKDSANPFDVHSYVDFDRIKLEMKYAITIADVKTNMSRSNMDSKEYAENYQQVLGEEAGWLINEVTKFYKGIFLALDKTEEDNKVEYIPTVLKDKYALLSDDAAAHKKARENLRFILEKQLAAKVGLIKVAQAVDLYMKAFTDGMSKDPDHIDDMITALSTIEVTANWFNEHSGNHLANLFECFPQSDVAIDNDCRTTVGSDGKYKPIGPNETYYEKLQKKTKTPGNPFLGRSLATMEKKELEGILELTGKAIKGSKALENIIIVFMKIGSKFGDIDPLASTFLKPGAMSDMLNEYLRMSAFATAFDSQIAELQALYLCQHTTAIANADTSGSDGVNAAWVLTVSVVGGGASVVYDASEAGIETSKDGKNPTDKTKAKATARGIHTGVRTANDKPEDKVSSLALSAIPSDSVDEWGYHDRSTLAHSRYDAALWRDDFYDTDLLFQMTVKSIVGKIFTVVDAYRLFHKPTNQQDLTYSLNPLRVILGGAADTPKIHDEAIALYFRLPLLAEWYREMYGFKAKGYKEDEWRITIAPHIDGIWSDLISVIFDQASFVTDGNYTDTQIRLMVSAMNNIWRVYRPKYPTNTVRHIVNAFVLEINRVMGFMQQKEIDKYQKERYDSLVNTSAYNPELEESLDDYDLLHSKDQYMPGTAPSDKYVNVGIKKSVTKKAISNVKLLDKVKKLRESMDKDFIAFAATNTSADDFPGMKFMSTINSFSTEVRIAKNEAQKYDAVMRMIQGTSQTIKDDLNKFIMIHEAVTAPLTVMYGVYRLVSRINGMLHGMSIKNLEAWSAVRAAAANASNTGSADEQLAARKAARIPIANKYHLDADKASLDSVSAEMTNPKTCKEAYKAFLAAAYPRLPDDSACLQSMLNVMFNESLSRVIRVGAGDGDGKVVVNAGLNTETNLYAEFMLETLLQLFMDIHSNGSSLIGIRMSQSGHINMDITGLKEMANTMLAAIRGNIAQLRTNFTVEDAKLYLDKYEDRTTVGSVRWLEEELMEVIFNNRYDSGIDVAFADHLQGTFQRLLSNTPTGLLHEKAGFGNVSYSHLLAKLVYYDTLEDTKAKNVANIARTSRVQMVPTQFPFVTTDLSSKYLKEYSSEDKAFLARLTNTFASIKHEVAPPGGKNAGGAHTLNDMEVIHFIQPGQLGCLAPDSEYNSLMFVLNRLIHAYLANGFEDGNSKFYAPLIESFATGSASYEVLQGKAFPDIGQLDYLKESIQEVEMQYSASIDEATTESRVASPAIGSILTASNALTIFQLLHQTVTMIGAVQKKKFLYENLAEIPEYMKDRMRTNLPYFSKMLLRIYDRADFITKLLMQTNLKQMIAPFKAKVLQAHTGARFTSDLKPWDGESSAQYASYLSDQLNKIMNLTSGLKKCSDSVYKELNDKPLYFLEPSKDFIADFKTATGAIPFIPASLSLVALKTQMPMIEANKCWDPMESEGYIMIPVRNNGSAVYRFNAGLKVVMVNDVNEPNIEQFVGAKELYNRYLEHHTLGQKISIQDYANTLKNMTKLVRFLANGMVYGKFFCRTGGYSGDDLSTTSVSVFSNRWDDPNVNICQATVTMQKTLPELLNLVESRVIQNTREIILRAMEVDVMSKPNGFDRKSLRTMNIIDLNIVPINVHSFMKEVAFVNILNYSYTADQMIHNFILPGHVRQERIRRMTGASPNMLMIQATDPVYTTRELLVKLLVHPWAPMDKRGVEYSLVGSLFNGNDSMQAGRPKYLSDQLWHKVLINGTAPLAYSYGKRNGLEGGPTALDVLRYNDLAEVPNGVTGITANMRNLGKLLKPIGDMSAEDVEQILSNDLAAIPGDKVKYTSMPVKKVYSEIMQIQPANVINTANEPNPDGSDPTHTLVFPGNKAVSVKNKDEGDKVVKLFEQLGIQIRCEKGKVNGVTYTATWKTNIVPELIQTHCSKLFADYHAALLAALPRDLIPTRTYYTATRVKPKEAGLKIYDVTLREWKNAPGTPYTEPQVSLAQEIGKARFDTRLVRNLTWVTLLQRNIRFLLARYLSSIDSPVVNGVAIVNPRMTEFKSADQNSSYSRKEFTSENFDW